MKICVTSKGDLMTSEMDSRFGRAEYFVFADTETMEYKVVENEAAKFGGGAGITSGQIMVDNQVKAIITGNVGPNAMNVLKAGKIFIYKGKVDSIENNIESFKNNLLEKIENTVPSHSGMKNGVK